MRNFAWLIGPHQKSIFGYSEVAIDNGSVEALNKRAKAISHRAFGYRTAGTFKLALYYGVGETPHPKINPKILVGSHSLFINETATCTGHNSLFNRRCD
jgi:hypothetical protein